jgi:hypothetical protein
MKSFRAPTGQDAVLGGCGVRQRQVALLRLELDARVQMEVIHAERLEQDPNARISGVPARVARACHAAWRLLRLRLWAIWLRSEVQALSPLAKAPFGIAIPARFGIAPEEVVVPPA